MSTAKRWSRGGRRTVALVALALVLAVGALALVLGDSDEDQGQLPDRPMLGITPDLLRPGESATVSLAVGDHTYESRTGGIVEVADPERGWRRAFTWGMDGSVIREEGWSLDLGGGLVTPTEEGFHLPSRIEPGLYRVVKEFYPPEADGPSFDEPQQVRARILVVGS